MAIAQRSSSAFALAFRPLRDMLVFSGRSTRTEVVAYFMLASVANLMTVTIDGGPAAPLLDAAKFAWGLLWSFPWIALLVRRLHDQDRSGWWALINLAYFLLAAALLAQPQMPASGMSVRFLNWVAHPAATPLSVLLFAVAFALAMVELILFLLAGTVGANRYGHDPRLDSAQ